MLISEGKRHKKRAEVLRPQPQIIKAHSLQSLSVIFVVIIADSLSQILDMVSLLIS
jgi:hypothetical protein